MTYADDFEAAIAKQVSIEMLERDLTQQDLADAVGIERATLSRYLTRKRSMPMPTFIAVAGALGVSPRELMERAEARIPAAAQTA